jgi:CheY-like chemotaxis protein
VDKKIPIVLVVEDEWIVRATIVDYLYANGCHVIGAGSGEEAVALIDVLFTDIRLGGPLNGWDIAEIFRDHFPDLRVLYALAIPSTHHGTCRIATSSTSLTNPKTFSRRANKRPRETRPRHALTTSWLNRRRQMPCRILTHTILGATSCARTSIALSRRYLKTLGLALLP